MESVARTKELLAVYESVCKRQRESVVRNTTLLKDTDRIQQLLTKTQHRHSQLNALKSRYQQYVASVYPQWLLQCKGQHRAEPVPQESECIAELTHSTSTFVPQTAIISTVVKQPPEAGVSSVCTHLPPLSVGTMVSSAPSSVTMSDSKYPLKFLETVPTRDPVGPVVSTTASSAGLSDGTHTMESAPSTASTHTPPPSLSMSLSTAAGSDPVSESKPLPPLTLQTVSSALSEASTLPCASTLITPSKPVVSMVTTPTSSTTQAPVVAAGSSLLIDHPLIVTGGISSPIEYPPLTTPTPFAGVTMETTPLCTGPIATPAAPAIRQPDTLTPQPPSPLDDKSLDLSLSSYTVSPETVTRDVAVDDLLVNTPASSHVVGSHSPQASTPLHSHSSPGTPSHSHSLPGTPSHTHSLPGTPSHTHSPPGTPSHSHSPPGTPSHTHSPPGTHSHPHSPPGTPSHSHSPNTPSQPHTPPYTPPPPIPSPPHPPPTPIRSSSLPSYTPSPIHRPPTTHSPDRVKVVTNLLITLNNHLRAESETVAMEMYSEPEDSDRMKLQISNSNVLTSTIVKSAESGLDCSTWDPSVVGVVLLHQLSLLTASHGSPIPANLFTEDAPLVTSQFNVCSPWSQVWEVLLEHVHLLHGCHRPLDELAAIFTPALVPTTSSTDKACLQLLSLFKLTIESGDLSEESVSLPDQEDRELFAKERESGDLLNHELQNESQVRDELQSGSALSSNSSEDVSGQLDELPSGEGQQSWLMKDGEREGGRLDFSALGGGGELSEHSSLLSEGSAVMRLEKELEGDGNPQPVSQSTPLDGSSDESSIATPGYVPTALENRVPFAPSQQSSFKRRFGLFDNSESELEEVGSHGDSEPALEEDFDF